MLTTRPPKPLILGSCTGEAEVFIVVGCDIVKGKAIPLQALTGPEGSRWLWLPDF
jgi:hypothetical protein